MVNIPSTQYEREYAEVKIKNTLHRVALLLVISGALNWGLIGLNGFDLVSQLFGPMSTLSRGIYVLVGMAGLYLTCTFRRLI